MAFAGLAERLALYLDELEQEKLLTDASAMASEPLTALDDALYFLLPIDCKIVLGVKGLRGEPWTAPVINPPGPS